MLPRRNRKRSYILGILLTLRSAYLLHKGVKSPRGVAEVYLPLGSSEERLLALRTSMNPGGSKLPCIKEPVCCQMLRTEHVTSPTIAYS